MYILLLIILYSIIITLLTSLEFTAKHGTTFYKVLANDLIHNEFTCKLGFNIDTNKFNPNGKCQYGELYFTNIKNVLRYLDYGPKIGIKKNTK